MGSAQNENVRALFRRVQSLFLSYLDCHSLSAIGFICLFMCKYLYVYTPVCGVCAGQSALFCHSLSHSLETGSPTELGARKLQRFSRLCSQAGYSCACRYIPFFYMCAGDLNSGSHALTYGVISSIFMVAFNLLFNFDGDRLNENIHGVC